MEYGERFPEFVEDASDTHRLAYLAAFARLDRAWSEVFFAEDEVPAAAQRTASSGGVTGVRADDGTPATSGRRSARPQRRPAPKRKPNGSGDGGPADGFPGDPATVMNLRGRLSPRARMVSLDHRVLDAWSELRQGRAGAAAPRFGPSLSRS